MRKNQIRDTINYLEMITDSKQKHHPFEWCFYCIQNIPPGGSIETIRRTEVKGLRTAKEIFLIYKLARFAAISVMLICIRF